MLPATAAAAPDPDPVTWSVEGDSVSFTWAAVRGVSLYEWALDPGGTVQQVTATHAVVPKASQGPTCILVHSVTPGAPDTPGTRACSN